MTSTSKWAAAFRDAFADRTARAASVTSAASTRIAVEPAATGAVGANGTHAAALPAQFLTTIALSAPAAVGLAWTAADWTAFYEERAGLMADNGWTETEIATQAFSACIDEWQRQEVASAFPDRCAYCGGPSAEQHQLVPFGTTSAGLWWLHHGCHSPWFTKRRQEAEKALRQMGLSDFGPAQIVNAMPASNDNSVLAIAKLSDIEEPTAPLVIHVEPTPRPALRKDRRPVGRPRRDAPPVESGPRRVPKELLSRAILDVSWHRLPVKFTLDQLRKEVDHRLLETEVRRMTKAGFFEAVGPDALRLVERFQRKRSASRYSVAGK